MTKQEAEAALLIDTPERLSAAPSAAPQPSMSANFSYIFMGNAVYSASQWGMLVVLARLTSPETVGQLGLALAVTAPVFMCALLQLRALHTTDSSQSFSFSHNFTVRVLACLAAFAFVAVMVLLSHYPSETNSVILLVALMKCSEGLSDILHGQLQQLERMKWIGLSVGLKGLLSMAAMAFVTWRTGDIISSLIVINIIWWALIFVVDAPAVAAALRAHGRDSAPVAPASLFKFSYDYRRLYLLFSMAFPLGLVSLLISFNTNIPRYFLEHYHGTRALGLYAALSYCIVASTQIASALGNSASTKLGKFYGNGDIAAFAHLMKKLVYLGLLFGLSGIAGVYFLGRFLLNLFYGPEYAEEHQGFLVLALAATAHNICFFLNWGVVAARRLKIQIPLHLAMMLVTVTACYLFVPSMGLLGATIAVAVAAACQCLSTLALLWHAISQQQRKLAVQPPETIDGLTRGMDHG